MWVQDFELKTKNSCCPPTCDFEETLLDYIQRIGVDSKRYKKYDFSPATVRLIISVPGYHTGSSVHKYGHMKIRNILKSQTFSEEFHQNINILCQVSSPILVCGKISHFSCQFSSVGSLSEKWIHEELLTSFASEKLMKSDLLRSHKPSIQFIWPTVNFVKECIDGLSAGTSLCCPSKNMKEFLTPILFKYEGQEGKERVPPHIKTFCRISKNSNHIPWICLTSCNMSKAAWGELQKNNSQLLIRHYEVGVLFLSKSGVSTEEKTTFQEFSLGKSPQVGSNQSIIFPIPYSFPPKKYSSHEKPWTWDELL